MTATHTSALTINASSEGLSNAKTTETNPAPAGPSAELGLLGPLAGGPGLSGKHNEEMSGTSHARAVPAEPADELCQLRGVHAVQVRGDGEVSRSEAWLN